MCGCVWTNDLLLFVFYLTIFYETQQNGKFIQDIGKINDHFEIIINCSRSLKLSSSNFLSLVSSLIFQQLDCSREKYPSTRGLYILHEQHFICKYIVYMCISDGYIARTYDFTIFIFICQSTTLLLLNDNGIKSTCHLQVLLDWHLRSKYDVYINVNWLSSEIWCNL